MNSLTYLLNTYEMAGTHNYCWNDSYDISARLFLKHCIWSINKFYVSNSSCHASSTDKRRICELFSLPQMSLLLRKTQRLCRMNSSSHSAKQEGYRKRQCCSNSKHLHSSRARVFVIGKVYVVVFARMTSHGLQYLIAI